MNYGQRFVTLYMREESRPSPRKRNAKRKWLSEEALKIAVKRREVKNRFKGLDLIDRVPEELWMEVNNILQEAVTKTIPKKMKFLRRQSDWLRILYK